MDFEAIKILLTLNSELMGLKYKIYLPVNYQNCNILEFSNVFQSSWMLKNINLYVQVISIILKYSTLGKT